MTGRLRRPLGSRILHFECPPNDWTLASTTRITNLLHFECPPHRQGPNDLPPGDGPWGAAVAQGDLWGDYEAVGAGERGILCAPEHTGKDGSANMC